MLLAYLKADDFPGADMARKFLQMGWTRARRYANHQGGRKYDKKTGEELPRTEDQEKAASAAIFYEKYVTARQHPEYVRQKKLHQERNESVSPGSTGTPARQTLLDARPGDHRTDLENSLPDHPSQLRVRVRPSDTSRWNIRRNSCRTRNCPVAFFRGLGAVERLPLAFLAATGSHAGQKMQSLMRNHMVQFVTTVNVCST